MRNWCLKAAAAVIFVVVIVGGILLDNRIHQGCKKVEGFSGGEYSYFWECP